MSASFPSPAYRMLPGRYSSHPTGTFSWRNHEYGFSPEYSSRPSWASPSFRFMEVSARSAMSTSSCITPPRPATTTILSGLFTGNGAWPTPPTTSTSPTGARPCPPEKWRPRAGFSGETGPRPRKNRSYNAQGLHVCLVGNDKTGELTSDLQTTPAGTLDGLMKKYGIPLENVKLHRDVGSTLCPGRHINLEQIRNWIEEYRLTEDLHLARQHGSVLSLADSQARKTSAALLAGLSPVLAAGMFFCPLAVFRRILGLAGRLTGGSAGARTEAVHNPVRASVLHSCMREDSAPRLTARDWENLTS